MIFDEYLNEYFPESCAEIPAQLLIAAEEPKSFAFKTTPKYLLDISIFCHDCIHQSPAMCLSALTQRALSP